MSGDIRIDIVWDDSLAGITILKGILTASKMEYKSKGIEYNEILRCKVTIDDSNGTGSLGFQSFAKGEGFSGEVFESLRESIDSLVRSYHEGYKLGKSVYTWISSYFYAITFVTINRHTIPGTRTIGIYNNQTYARNYVENIKKEDPARTKYLVIEQTSYGATPKVEREFWFEWYTPHSRYKGIKRPAGVGQFQNFSVG
jgi:hypothetical protein